MSFFEQIRKSSGLYPITQLYIVAVACIAAVIQGLIGFTSAIVILALAAVMAILVASWSELKQIHRMIDGQRSELVKRIDALTGILADNGVRVPAEDEKVHEARAEGD